MRKDGLVTKRVILWTGNRKEICDGGLGVSIRPVFKSEGTLEGLVKFESH